MKTLTLLTLTLALLLALAPPPALAAGEPAGLDARVDLQVSESDSSFDLYRALARAAGLTVAFDPGLKDLPVAVDLSGVTVREGLERLTRATGHFYTLTGSHTLTVALDTPQNRRELEPLEIRTFYLENTDVKDMMTVLRSLVEAKRIAVVEGLDALTVRDVADKVALAEELVRRHDKQRAEVEVAVEVLSLDRGAVEREEGAELPLRFAAGELERLKRSAGTRILAAPHLSAVEGERARLVLGEAVPIHTAGGGDGEEGKSETAAVSYQDVGLELALRPRVHAGAGEVTLELHAGLSGVVGGAAAERYPVVARRSLDAQIRLGDGETCLLTGLLWVEPRPGSRLAPLPLLAAEPAPGGPSERRELAVALTVRIVRRPQITDQDRRSLPIGTESSIRLGD